MKKLFFLLLMFSIALTTLAQGKFKISYGDTINRIDSKNLKQGLWLDTINHIPSRGNYVNGNKDGMWITYNYRGFVFTVESYKNGVKNGAFINFDDSGNMKEEYYYKNGNLNGHKRTFATGERLMHDVIYINGALNGLSQIFYESNDKVQEEGYYKNGVRDSVTKWFNTDGKLMAEYFYKNGKFDGMNKIFFESGNVEREEAYSNNIENGVHKEYFDTTIVKKPTPPDTKPNKNTFEDAGKVKMIGNYINGKKDGRWFEYDRKGNVVRTAVFKNGVEK